MDSDKKSFATTETHLNLLGLTYPEFLNLFQTKTGKGDFFTRPLYKQVMTKGIFAPEKLPAFINSPKVLEKTSKLFSLSFLKKEKHLIDEQVEKLAFKTHDGYLLESVIIPMKNRTTLCISSQIGCLMGCVFCETGKMGFKRNLKVDEIVSQVFFVRNVLKYSVRNIVFMGMGEPLSNMENVSKAIEIFTSDFGWNYKRTHITLSTAGLIPELEIFHKSLSRKSLLAVSLNAANNTLRNRLMPINRKYNLEQLHTTLKKISSKRYFVLLEYVLIKGINDSLKDADEVVRFCQNLDVRLNLIPYNPGFKSPYLPPDESQSNLFYQYLYKNGVHVILRKSRGQNIMAACGQLSGSD